MTAITDDDDLDAIEARLRENTYATDDVHYLLAEVRRLRGVVDRLCAASDRAHDRWDIVRAALGRVRMLAESGEALTPEALESAINAAPADNPGDEDDILAEVRRLRRLAQQRDDLASHLADWHEDNPAVMEICQRGYGSPLEMLAAVREWLDS